MSSTTTATVDLGTALGELRLPNPLMTASGCAAAGRELHQFFDVAELGRWSPSRS
jgi:dihydroorotate dehydrogenase (NAD+) catalytic subunit